MLMTRGTVVNGKIVVEGEPLNEGSRVMILASDGTAEQGFRLGLKEEEALLASIREADAGETISEERLLQELGGG